MHVPTCIFCANLTPSSLQHTGLWGSEHFLPGNKESEGKSWNTSRLSAFAVLAETEQDFQAAVRFAAKHNLRLVVKATGHDWYGRSYAPDSLLLWTHRRKKIDFREAFVPAGSDQSGVPAVTVESGVQFSDIYPAAQATPYPSDPFGRKTIVMGGTCDSVGVGGCWMGGCYGPFTKKFGNGAINLLEANVVLANGSLVTCNEAQHPDLFWTLRGGGGGNTGVVTSFTARTHPAPRYTVSSGFSCRGKDMAGFKACTKFVLKSSSEAMHWSSTPGVQDCGGGGPNFDSSSFSAGFSCGLQWEGEANRTAALYAPLLAWCKQPAQVSLGLSCSSSSNVNWKQSDYTSPTDRKYSTPEYPDLKSMPWIELKPDREISTRMLGSLTKYFPMAGGMDEEDGRESLTDGITKIDAIVNEMRSSLRFTSCIMGAKAQSGLSPELVEQFSNTAQNPVLLNTVGLWLMYFEIPDLPQLPPSATLLKALWPRLQQYAITSPKDPLHKTCTAGASGDEGQAVACMDGWAKRIPAYAKQVDAIRQQLWSTFPNKKNGQPYSGSYWNEADFEDPHFQESHWGKEVYAKLLALKQKYDPAGLFVCHHCVGSEMWSADGNCRLS
jgi:hypothetical protein